VIDGLQLYAVQGVAQKHHLFPFDLAEQVVLDHHNFHRQLVFDTGAELGQEHGKTAVADKRDAVPIGIGDLRRNRIREAVGHGCRVGWVRPSGVGFDGHAQPIPAQLQAEMLGPLPRSAGYDAGATGVDLPGMSVCFRPRHRRNDPAQRMLDVVEAVTVAIQHDDLVGPQLADTAQQIAIELGLNCGRRWCGRHARSIASLRSFVSMSHEGAAAARVSRIDRPLTQRWQNAAVILLVARRQTSPERHPP
jgi:hypothetical protein